MKVKKYIELDENDIRELVTEKLKCDVSKVKVTYVPTWVGYGPDERQVTKIKITVDGEVEL